MSLILSVILFIGAAGADGPLCTGLGSYGCNLDSEHADFTGKTVTGRQFVRGFIKAREAVALSTGQRIAKGLKSDAGFRQLAIKAWNLQELPECRSTKKAKVAECNTILQTLLHEVATRQLGIPAAEPLAQPNLAALDELKNDKTYSALIKDGLTQAADEVALPKEEKKLREGIIPEVVAQLIEQIKAAPMDPGLRKGLIEKVSAMKIGDKMCTSDNQLSVPSIVLSSSYYSWDEGERNTFRYCPSLLSRTTSEFQLVFVMAHEMSHSIDPCLIAYPAGAEKSLSYTAGADRAERQRQNPWGEVLGCLRGADSLNALSAPATDGSNPSHDFCAKDQISEAFADWMATEILSRYVAKHYQPTAAQAREGYANALRLGDCAPAKDVGDDPHPAMIDRIDRIIAAHPKVREQMGCGPQPGVRYCDIKGTPAATGAAPAPAEPPAPADEVKGVR